MIIQCIHGIHSPEGNNNMSAFQPRLQAEMPQTHVGLFEYGFMGFWKARWANDRTARDFVQHCAKENDESDFEVWITHSNGAAIAYLAVRDHGARPDMIINFNPALDRWRSADIPWVETIHSDGDRAVWLSQWLPGHIWGDQGKVGYRGKRKRVLNHAASKFGPAMAYKNHMGAFSSSRIDMWADFTARRIESYYRLWTGADHEDAIQVS